jgi:signal transduction histidine kinase
VFLAVSTTSTFLEAIIGGYILIAWGVDPIFRKDTDAFKMIATLAGIALIGPILSGIDILLQHGAYSAHIWQEQYVASLFSYLLFTPFILRWCAKPFFSRTWREIIEITAVFTLLVMINTILFIQGTQYLFNIPVAYLLLIPFLTISLRLRPRFVTLSLCITALFTMYSFQYTNVDQVFATELLLIVVSIIFYIIAALEEHRRLNANQMLSQVATLKNAVARVTTESRAKNDFIAILAHELRNPLTPVVSGIELMKHKINEEEKNAILGSMEEGMHTVRRLLNDLLDVSRISEGKIALKKKVIDLEPILDHAVHATDHHRKERHQNLVFKGAPSRLRIFADPVRIEQIFSNLLTNASKYSNEGDTVTMQLRGDCNFAEIAVIDEGVGLEPDTLEHIFEPFQQVPHGDRTHEGLGIGLSLVRDFVKMHGGRVWVESKGKNKGSRFVVRLPLVNSSKGTNES